MVLSLYILFLTIQQFYLLMNGQTWHEYGKQIAIYNSEKSIQSKFEVIFGKRWYTVLFSPLIASAPLGDGMHFDTASTGSGHARVVDSKQI